jgi:Uma2 family endonuclease
VTTVVERRTFRTLAELWDRLGNVPLDRIRLDPRPGTATRGDLLGLVERRGRDRYCELVAGTVVEKVVGRYESTLAMWLGVFLGDYLRAHPIGQMTAPDGPYDTVPDQVRMPDVGFVLNERILEAGAEGDAILRIPPDLAVEIVSPGNTRREMEIKLEEYFECGVRLVWYVDPRQRTVRVFTSPGEVRELSEDDVLGGGDVLPGFELSIREWFERASVKP